jgi:NTP pyrophosphatase (non-canonical NTP hydrolase)
MASDHELKPTVLNSDIVEMFGEDNNGFVKLFYPDFNVVIEYKENRKQKTWQAQQRLFDGMALPTVGSPVFHTVTPYTELITNELQPIRDWANDRNLIEQGDSKTQYLKLIEECGELSQAILKSNKSELVDAIGDIIVVLTNLAAIEDVKVEDCLNSAYNVIKNRKGKMINGTFVKEI